MKILLADDHTLVRAGIRALLQDLRDVMVIAEAAEGREALELSKQRQPDVALIDIGMPGLNGIELTARLTRECPQVRVLILSMHLNEEYILQAMRAGARGYLIKGADTAELELALRAVMSGETYLSPAVRKLVTDDYLRRSDNEAHITSVLTPRQREILQLLAEGHSTKEIAQLLNISAKTVETHRADLMQRLNIYDLAGLTRYAMRTGLIGSE